MNRKEMSQKFAEEIEVERVRLGLSQSDMAKALDVSLSTYKNILNGNTDRIDVYSAYLVKYVTGKSFLDLLGIETPELKMLEIFKDLTATQREYIVKVAEFERDFKVSHDKAEDYIPLLIPTVDMQDGMLWDSCQLDHFNASAYKKRYGRIDCAIKVTSDHLSPIYIKGDVLLLNQVAPRDGDIGVFVSKETGRAYLRKLIRNKDGAEIVPVNGTGLTYEVSLNDTKSYNKWIKYGVVVAKAR